MFHFCQLIMGEVSDGGAEDVVGVDATDLVCENQRLATCESEEGPEDCWIGAGRCGQDGHHRPWHV